MVRNLEIILKEAHDLLPEGYKIEVGQNETDVWFKGYTTDHDDYGDWDDGPDWLWVNETEKIPLSIEPDRFLRALEREIFNLVRELSYRDINLKYIS